MKLVGNNFYENNILEYKWNKFLERKPGIFQFLEKHDPDIFCVQEIKTSHEKLPDLLKEFPFHFYHFAEKAGYSGTVIFSKQKPKVHSFGLEDIDSEGRVIALEFSDFFLVNVYTPNAKNDLSRLDYRRDVWDKTFLNYVQKLSLEKDMIVCGDLNVLGSDLDLQHYEHYRENIAFQKKIIGERVGLQNILNSGFIDSFRNLYPDEIKYSWISPPGLGLPGNRLDYFLVSENLMKNVIDSNIDNCCGSDHLPIVLEMKNEFQRETKEFSEKVFFPEMQQPSLF